MPRALTTTLRRWGLTPPLAVIILASAVTVGALTRPGATESAAPSGYREPTPDDGGVDVDVVDDEGDTYRRGNRPAGRRGGSEPAPAPATITIRDFAFDGPASVAAGTSLTVTNGDGVPHTLTFRSGQADTGTLDGGASATIVAPDEPGTYAFFCRIHPSMEGEIEITA